jgi:hypothetical protein
VNCTQALTCALLCASASKQSGSLRRVEKNIEFALGQTIALGNALTPNSQTANVILAPVRDQDLVNLLRSESSL